MGSSMKFFFFSVFWRFLLCLLEKEKHPNIIKEMIRIEHELRPKGVKDWKGWSYICNKDKETPQQEKSQLRIYVIK